ncbi:MAG: hypothetical protein ACMG6E_00855 [Candidatus Roizmanbacteria bacterium]
MTTITMVVIVVVVEAILVIMVEVMAEDQGDIISNVLCSKNIRLLLLKCNFFVEFNIEMFAKLLAYCNQNGHHLFALILESKSLAKISLGPELLLPTDELITEQLLEPYNLVPTSLTSTPEGIEIINLFLYNKLDQTMDFRTSMVPIRFADKVYGSSLIVTIVDRLYVKMVDMMVDTTKLAKVSLRWQVPSSPIRLNDMSLLQNLLNHGGLDPLSLHRYGQINKATKAILAKPMTLDGRTIFDLLLQKEYPDLIRVGGISSKQYYLTMSRGFKMYTIDNHEQLFSLGSTSESLPKSKCLQPTNLVRELWLPQNNLNVSYPTLTNDYDRLDNVKSYCNTHYGSSIFVSFDGEIAVLKIVYGGRSILPDLFHPTYVSKYGLTTTNGWIALPDIKVNQLASYTTIESYLFILDWEKRIWVSNKNMLTPICLTALPPIKELYIRDVAHDRYLLDCDSNIWHSPTDELNFKKIETLKNIKQMAWCEKMCLFLNHEGVIYTGETDQFKPIPHEIPLMSKLYPKVIDAIYCSDLEGKLKQIINTDGYFFTLDVGLRYVHEMAKTENLTLLMFN